MSHVGANAGAGAAAGAAADHVRMVSNGLKASGAIVHVDPDVFVDIIQKSDDPLVVVSKQTRWFTTFYAYLTNYKGLFFYVESPEVLAFSEPCEMILVKKIWIPTL